MSQAIHYSDRVKEDDKALCGMSITKLDYQGKNRSGYIKKLNASNNRRKVTCLRCKDILKSPSAKKIKDKKLDLLVAHLSTRDQAERIAKVRKNRGFKCVTITKEADGYAVYGK